MTITINGKEAAIKQNCSFDFISENRHFSGADSYSLTITFPLKNCQQNLAIFGNINRKDVARNQIIFPCEIRSGKFHKSGSITITELTDTEVKTQFLEGQSVNNYLNTFDNIYINEIELEYPNTDASSFPISKVKNPNDCTYTALPWVNNNTGNMQNEMNLSSNNPSWACEHLSYQPYMRWLVEKMMEKLGYTHDFSEWADSAFSNLLCCNTVPYAWNMPSFTAALPHWTMTEFLEQLELLMNCEFNIDHSNKTISMNFVKHVIEDSGEVELNNVLDDFQVELIDAEDCKYKGLTNLKYADCDHRMWQYYVNPEFIKYWKERFEGTYKYKEMDNIQDFLDRGVDLNFLTVEDEDIAQGSISALYYCTEEDRYIIIRAIKFNKTGSNYIEGFGDVPYGNYNTIPQIVNAFEPRIVNENMETQELKIVPVWLDFTTPQKGQCIFLQLPDLNNEQKASQQYNGFSNWDEAFAHLSPEADYFIKELQTEEQKAGTTEYLDKIYVGFNFYHTFLNQYPHPEIDYTSFDYNWNGTFVDECSLALKSNLFIQYTPPAQIDPTQKYTFKFLANDIPNVRSIFYIHGQKYVCEKITATFDAQHGMSKLMKAVCYRCLS